MTINDLIEQGLCIQGSRKVTAMADGGSYDEITLYEGNDEWYYSTLEEEWADWEINYLHPGRNEVVFELDNPNS